MKCPLLIIGYLSIPDKGVNEKSECIKKECAWWNESIKKCCIPVLAANAIVLNLFIEEIADKLLRTPR